MVQVSSRIRGSSHSPTVVGESDLGYGAQTVGAHRTHLVRGRPGVARLVVPRRGQALAEGEEDVGLVLFGRQAKGGGAELGGLPGPGRELAVGVGAVLASSMPRTVNAAMMRPRTVQLSVARCRPLTPAPAPCPNSSISGPSVFLSPRFAPWVVPSTTTALFCKKGSALCGEMRHQLSAVMLDAHLAVSAHGLHFPLSLQIGGSSAGFRGRDEGCGEGQEDEAKKRRARHDHLRGKRVRKS